jgi:hypothetical protein
MKRRNFLKGMLAAPAVSSISVETIASKKYNIDQNDALLTIYHWFKYDL